MTEHNGPNQTPFTASDEWAEADLAAAPTAPSDADNPGGTTSEDDAWATVHPPGQLPLTSLELPVDGDPAPAASVQQPPTSAELLLLIQDLNQCNDALLARVTELEEALERSQAALQSEVERSQAQGQTAGQRVPSQVAQLLTELEIANDGLRRTTIHNEALQVELDASQQRVAQMEREYTLLQQRFNERSNALQQAETTCRDLRTRLHRQQRYTLQFKAALEKCLNMSSEHSVASLSASLQHQEASASQPLAMPKAQQIQPWAAAAEAVPADPSLTHLLRGLKSVGQGPASVSRRTDADSPALADSPSAAMPAHPATDFVSSSAAASVPILDAEAALWDDLERLTAAHAGSPIEGFPEPLVGSAVDPDPASVPPSAPPATEPMPTFTEPSPWGAPLPPTPVVAPANTAAPGEDYSTVDLPPEVDAPMVEPEAGAPELGSPKMAVPPREPSPLAAPISARPGGVTDYGNSASSAAAALPGQPPQTSPSPVVYPLRSKKKLTSLAAVQLPNFSSSRRHG